MKFKNALPVLAMLMVGLMMSCSNQLDSDLASRNSEHENSAKSLSEGNSRDHDRNGKCEKDSLDHDRDHRNGGHHGNGNDSVPPVIGLDPKSPVMVDLKTFVIPDLDKMAKFAADPRLTLALVPGIVTGGTESFPFP